MTGDTAIRVHGTAIALGASAALIRGASGSGKSDLALRCIGMPAGPLAASAARLVADDQVLISPAAGGLIVSPPPTIAGRLEVRGLGIVEVQHVSRARLALIVDLVAPNQVQRMPEDRRVTLAGVDIPAIELAPFEASAAIKLLLCLARQGG